MALLMAMQKSEILQSFLSIDVRILPLIEVMRLLTSKSPSWPLYGQPNNGACVCKYERICHNIILFASLRERFYLQRKLVRDRRT